MKRIETNAVVLNARDTGESDLLVTLLARRTGRITGMAKAAKKSKKRFVNAFDRGNIVTVSMYRPRNRELFLIEDASLIDDCRGECPDLEALARMSVILELVLTLAPEEEPTPELFDDLVAALTILSARGAREDVMWMYLVRLLEKLGLAPFLTGCVRCGKKVGPEDRTFFSPRSGGTICTGCRDARDEGIHLSAGTRRSLSASLSTSPDRMGRIILTGETKNEIRQALPLFIHHQVGKRLVSLDFFERYIVDGNSERAGRKRANVS